MPIEFTPPRRMLNAFLRLRERLRGRDGGPDSAPKLTVETVESVNDDGTYQVRGSTLTPTGLAQLEPGQGVTVAWKQGAPSVIVSHQVERSKFQPPQVALGPDIEMLLAAPTETPPSPAQTRNKLDVYFRNAGQNTLLSCRRLLEAQGFVIADTTLTLPSWGLDHRRFVVQFRHQPNNHLILAVFKLSGDERTAMTGTARASLQKTYDVSTSALLLTTASWTKPSSGIGLVTTPVVLGVAVTAGYSVPSGFPAPSIVQTIGAGLDQVVLRRDGHLLGVFSLRIVNSVGLAPVVEFSFPYLIDLTAGAVLLDGVASLASWPVTIYDGAHFNADQWFPTVPLTSEPNNGGVAFFVVPSREGGTERLFAGARQANLGNGNVAYWLGARNVATGTLETIFPTQTVGSQGVTPIPAMWLATFGERYVMWALVLSGAGDAANSGLVFHPPFSSTMAYTFQGGLRITDLGPTERPFVIKTSVPLTVLADILTFFDAVPYLIAPSLMWEDHNDLRVSGSSTPRTAPELVTFRRPTSGSPGFEVIVPFALPLRRFTSIPNDISTMKRLADSLSFVAKATADAYIVDSHQDPLVGYTGGLPLSLQALPLSGVALPTR